MCKNRKQLGLGGVLNGCSSGGPQFNCQHSQSSVTLVPGHLRASSGLREHNGSLVMEGFKLARGCWPASPSLP